MKKKRKTGIALVCPDALLREQLRTLAPGKEDRRGEHAGPLCIRTEQMFSLLEHASEIKREA